jgi:hypothetical protein
MGRGVLHVALFGGSYFAAVDLKNISRKRVFIEENASPQRQESSRF